jgi:LmbE family N-acetylglucosaminyl deacetylase
VSLALLPALAQAAPLRPPQQNAAQLERQLDKLLVVGNVLYVAAHPDDENTRLLAFFANGALLRTGYLSITRGDGGQNLIGRELGAGLGLIRTQELLAARGVDGAEQLFTRARDFGFSKSPAEALAIWGHDEVLSDVVLAIRSFKPDVVVARFNPSFDNDGFETHGHHTASARLAVEAFNKASDPAYMPSDAHRALGVWQPKRVVLNVPFFGTPPPGNAATTSTAGLLSIDVGGYDQWLGLSYGELAADSRSMHKSQGFGASRRRGAQPEYFKLLAGAPMASSPFDGLTLDWSRVPGAQGVATALAQARAAFKPATPEAALPGLFAARTALDALPENPWKAEKRAAIEQAIVACAGLFAEVTSASPTATPGSEVSLTASALLRRPVSALVGAVRLESVEVLGDMHLVARELREGLLVEDKYSRAVPATFGVRGPHWLETPALPGLYPGLGAGSDPLLALQPEVAQVEAELIFSFAGVPSGSPAKPPERLVVRRRVAEKTVDPVLGERYRELQVLPKVTLDPLSPLLVFTTAEARALRLRVRSANGASGSVTLDAPAGFTFTPGEVPFTLKAGGEAEVVFTVTPPAAAATGSLRARARLGAEEVPGRVLRVIDHAHIPVQTMLPPAEVKLVRADVLHARHRVGYVQGPGDDVPEVLQQAGYEVTLLTPAAVREQPLAFFDSFDALVFGIRAFNTEPGMLAANDKLVAFAGRGGVVLVQYLTAIDLGEKRPLGPAPFTIGRARVTDEEAAVEVSADPALAGPNALGPADWQGWVQERGLYFASTWDARWATPLAMHDPNEGPQKGSLLIARHGKGAFIYTGLAFFRQLPAGVPGALRLFANLLDAGAPSAPAAHATPAAKKTEGPRRGK